MTIGNILVMGVLFIALDPEQPQQDGVRGQGRITGQVMDREDVVCLRAIVKKGCPIIAPGDTGFLDVQVSLSKELIELHRKNRSGTLQVLLDILKTGEPADALSVGILVIALEDNPRYAAICLVDLDLDCFDNKVQGGPETGREELIKKVQHLVAKVK